jgi:DNA processing protein
VVEERTFWLAWSQVAGIGPTLLFRLHQHFGQLAIAWEATAAELEAVEGFGSQTAQTVVQGRSQIDPVSLLEEHQQENPRFWTPADANYPRLLLEISDPPPLLYYRGQGNPQDLLEGMGAIAIVGTRDPSDYGRRWTRRISAALAQAGYTVVSGLADGVDAEAHRSCLNAGGRTIAVMGTGVNIIYPWSNRTLSRQITQQGLLLTEYPAGTQPDRANFPRRNRIVAGLCRATLVLEAPHKSGALITARLANDYGRDVYALPNSLDNLKSIGCLELISTGAQIILGESQLLEMLEVLPNLSSRVSSRVDSKVDSRVDSRTSGADAPAIATQLSLELPAQLQSVLKAIPSVTEEAIAIDLLVEKTALPTHDVLSALSQLELMDLVTRLPGGQYQKV